MNKNKEKKDILLINPFMQYEDHNLGVEGSKELEKLLIERTEGKVWIAEFEENGSKIKRFEHPKGQECITSENGKCVTYSKNLYMTGDSGLLEPNFKLLKCFGAVVDVARRCPREDSRVEYEPLLTIAPTLIIGSCNCTPHLNKNFSTTLYTIGYRKGEEYSHLANACGARVAPIRSIEDMADVITGMLLNNEAIQEKAATRLAKLEADYQTLTHQWKRQ